MGAIRRRLEAARESRESKLPRNEEIVRYQQETIGELERQYAAGEISEQDYRERYGYYAEIIRRMGK
jgi:hypothetical protein